MQRSDMSGLLLEAKPSQAKPSQAKPSQAKPSQSVKWGRTLARSASRRPLSVSNSCV